MQTHAELRPAAGPRLGTVSGGQAPAKRLAFSWTRRAKRDGCWRRVEVSQPSGLLAIGKDTQRRVPWGAACLQGMPDKALVLEGWGCSSGRGLGGGGGWLNKAGVELIPQGRTVKKKHQGDFFPLITEVIYVCYRTPGYIFFLNEKDTRSPTTKTEPLKSFWGVFPPSF